MMIRNVLLVAGVALLVVVPLATVPASFAGTDDQARTMITTIQPDYVPWATPLWKPPSSEVECLLFSVQAALGAGLLGYYFGVRRGRAQRSGRASHDAD